MMATHGAVNRSKQDSRASAARRGPRLLWPAVAAVAIAVLAATAFFTRPASVTAQGCSATGAKTGILVGQCAPDFTLSDLNGKAVSLVAFHGRPVMIHFWGVPCTSCAAEYPDFLRAVRTYGPKGLAVLAVESWGQSMQQTRQWQTAHHLPAVILVDPATSVPTQYGVQGTPTTFYVDSKGRISAVVPGIESYSDFQRHLTDIM